MNLEHKSKCSIPAFVGVFFHSDGHRVHNNAMSNLQFYKLQTALDRMVETGKATAETPYTQLIDDEHISRCTRYIILDNKR